MINTEYPIILEAGNEKSYEEVAVLLSDLTEKSEQKNGKRYYSLDGDKAPQIRTDAGKKTIELTDKVDSEIISLIKHALNIKNNGEISNIFKS
ncbi:MAG: hypothetical protein AABY15_08180 [Nanoarchaeota archaeon]